MAHRDAGLPSDEEGASRGQNESGGNRIARVLFCIAEGEMVLLHAFMKKSQKIPKSDLDLAIETT